MIADFDFSSVRYAAEVIGRTGAEVLSTNNGTDAVNIVSEENIDIVFVNMWLPSKSGYDVAREIRKISNNKSKIPIIGYATGPTFEDKQQCIEAGCNNYLLKPVYPQQFLEILKKYL